MSQCEHWLCSDVLLEVLSAHPEGLTEHQLLKWLADHHYVDLDDDCYHDMMKLFRVHFLLFHRLYHLQNELHSRQSGSLSIHTLNIRLIPYHVHEKSLTEEDSLKNYYLNIKHLEEMVEEELDHLLAGFWKTYHRSPSQEARQEALALLGLDDLASDYEIKRAWRRLAMRHHPDRGGDEEQIKALNHAVNLLLSG